MEFTDRIPFEMTTNSFLPLGKFCPRGIVVGSVRLSVRLSVGRACQRDNSSRILPRISIFALNVYLGTLQNAMKMGSIDLDLQGNFGLKLIDFRKFELVSMITRQGFDLESLFLHRMCILGPFRTLLKIGLIHLDLQGPFGLKLIDFRKFELVRTITH